MIQLQRGRNALRQLVRDTHSRKVAKGVGTVGALRVDHCKRLRNRVARLMVIRDDHVEAKLVCAGDFIDRGDSAVDGDDQLCSLTGG